MDITKSNQNQWWIDFYEHAWKTRAKKIEELIESGEVDPLRVVEKMLRWNSDKELWVDDDGNVSFKDESDQQTTGLLPTGKPAFRRVVMPYGPVDFPYYNKPFDLILDYLESHSFDAVVELGSGIARNLIEIFSR